MSHESAVENARKSHDSWRIGSDPEGTEYLADCTRLRRTPCTPGAERSFGLDRSVRYTSRRVIRAPGSQEGRTGRINGILRHGRAAARLDKAPLYPAGSSLARYARPAALTFVIVGLMLLLPATAQAEAPATVTSPDGVNLRSGPGTSFPILVAIPFGAAVSVTGDPVDAVWVPVTYNGQAGFVMGEFLTIGTPQSNASGPPPPTPSPTPPPSATPTPAPAPSPQAAPAGTGGPGAGTWATVTPPDGLNLRQGPGTGFAVLIAVPGGARVQVVGQPSLEGWYSVVYQNRLGWVDGKYLTFGAPAPASATPTPTPGAGARPTPSASSVPATPSRFIWPVESRRISTVFSSTHPAIDIDEYPNGNNPVLAIEAGTVTFAGGDPCCSYGLYVVVKHADGYTSLYSHLSSISVSEGQAVRQGGQVGKSGNTGLSTGPHVHLEIRKDGVAIDPLTLLPGPSVIE